MTEVGVPGRGQATSRESGATPSRAGRETTRRRPSGAPPALPRDLRTTGAGWLICAAVAILVTVLIFRNGVRGAAITATVVDDTVVRWMSDIDLPGIHAIARGVNYASSWWAIEVTIWLLTVALIVFRRWRHLLIYLVVSQVAQLTHAQLYDLTTQPRPFGVPLRGSWGGWSLPSIQMLSLAGLSVIALYTLVPAGQLRNRLKWVVAVVVALVALARLHLGVDSPSAILVGVLIGVSFPLTAFRYFAPNEIFPVTYRRGRTAHLDVGGSRGEAIRKAVAEQLGLIVTEIRPVGLSESAGSTPLRLRVEGGSSPYLFGKLYSRSHLRADRWYKLGRELLYGRLEDEKPFNTVRRLVQQEDYALRVVREAGAPGAKSYGFVELTPEREYMLVTEFLDDAVELGIAVVDEALIDEALHLIRILWDAGLAHRDIKPANLMVRDGRILLIDVAFAELRPTPWRQAVDLANMMLCLALRSSAQQVYDRALRQFTIEEVSEAFAAARGLALPSGLRRALRAEGRDLHGEFLRQLPERTRPIKVQRWGFRRLTAALVTAIVIILLALNLAQLSGISDNTHTPVNAAALCDEMEPMWLQAQAVPTAALVPCVTALPVGWSFGLLTVNN
ncbi:MAG TPA: phosphatase PAP2 family protein, partial [Ilumatobacteraceae bacterium]|nr:phosphatase PAP2 family protein [Ilumatobacteraceae bacterium]